MNGLITRQAMVDAMAQEFNADVTERIGHDWRRVNAMVADQGDGQVAVSGFDFLFLEVYLSGSHKVQTFGDFQSGDRWEGLYQPGCFSFLQSDSPCEMEVEGQGKIQQMYFDKTIFTDCADALFKGDPDRIAMRGIHGVFDPELKALCDALLEEARRPAIGTDLYTDLIAQQMALLILRRQNADGIIEPKSRKLSPAETARIISYLEEQIENIGGMDTVAALVDMDVYAFTRAFKLTTGQTPGQFLIERRLARVKDLLLSTNDTLADITYATGFSNQPHMTSTFSKHVGTSPGKWRKAVKG